LLWNQGRNATGIAFLEQHCFSIFIENLHDAMGDEGTLAFEQDDITWAASRFSSRKKWLLFWLNSAFS
jgi:hypothetical protein